MGAFIGAVWTAIQVAACIIGIGFFGRLGVELADFCIYRLISEYLEQSEGEAGK
jgi:hypothetical protein